MTRFKKAAGLVIAAAVMGKGAQAMEPINPEGDWRGSLMVAPGTALRLALHLKKTDGALQGTLDSLDQGVNGLSLANLDGADARLAFDVPKVGGHFVGAWDPQSQGYVGEWSQGQAKLPLTLVRAPRDRPQRLNLDGTWDGALEVAAGVKLRLVLTLASGSTGATGSLQSIDQGRGLIPLSGASREGEKVTLEFTSIGGAFSGDVSPDGKTLNGLWTQGGRQLPLALSLRGKGADAPFAVRRPQEPRPPFPYSTLEVSYDNPAGANRLAGTLTVPHGSGPFPAALLITGSGLQDRDETVFGHKPFLVLADYLTRRGVAVLRVDDRTIGGSTGDVVHATSADFATDVEAGVAFLKKRPDIDGRKIGLIGHSEGGMIAPMVAVKDPSVAWIVMMAGPGVDGERLLREQGRLIRSAMGMSDEDNAKADELNARAFAAVRSAKDEQEAHEKAKAILLAAGMSDAAAEAAAAPLSTDWMRFFLKYDPAPTLKQVQIPILAIAGSLDLQVPPKEDLAAIREATRGDKDVTTLELPGLNHLFQTAKTGAPSEYQTLEETFSPVALKAIGDWIEARTR